MTPKVLLILSSIVLLFSFNTQAQNRGWCGTTDSKAIAKRLIKNKEAIRNGVAYSRTPVYVPVKFHIVTESDGTGGVSIKKLLEQLTALNTDFADSDIQFYFSNYFDQLTSSTVNQSQGSFLANTEMNAIRDNNAVDIFLTDKVSGNPNQPGTALGVYSPFRDWIVILNNQVNANSGTVSHEVGHFFSLNHTHDGWDSKQWDHTNPTPIQVGNTSPEGIPTEKQDGSNCQTAGDLICDTPPDYNFGLGWSKDGDRCGAYDGGVKDPNGDIVDPMENNFMGYFIACDQYIFTAEQMQVMTADYKSAQRAYLRSGFIPNLNPITDIPVLVEPIGGETTAGYDIVNLDWNGVANADRYLLQVDRLPDFSFDLQEYVVDGTSYVLRNLEASKNYFWRVIPFNEYDTDALPTQSERFKTGADPVSATNQIEGVNNWFLTPNPLSTQKELSLHMNTTQSFVADVKIFSITGQEMLHMNQQQFNIGESNLKIDASNFNAGMYIVTIQTETAIINKKLIVQ